ncbi:hypothetical protein CO659_12850 [Rhizobium sp. S9]|nr:hypothetical protein CO659_12850 [Rhizobium sp. S9]
MGYCDRVEVDALLGKTLAEVRRDGDEEIYFVTTDGDTFKMYHSQDCCECVEIEDIEGDLQSLVGNPIIVAEEVSQEDQNASESGTWTFYKLATIKGHVDIRWYGSSNGYYSESVQFEKVTA